MGVLHKLTLVLRRIDPGNKSWEELQKERARQKANDAFDTKDDDARREQLSEISETFAHYRDSDFGRKLYLIQNSIFGVDIQPVACQIAKLRFFISLTIEQTPTRDKSKNFGIKPLPNLETRFIAADTLIGLRLTGKDSLQSPAIRELEEKLKQNRERHFNAKTRQKKLDCSKKDQKLRQKLAKTLEEHYQRDAVGNEAKRVVDEETKKLTRQLSDYRNKVELGKQDTLLENTGNQQSQTSVWDKEIAKLEVAIVKKRELVNAILQQDESVKSSVVWRKAEEAVENRNVQIHAESEKISQWDPYDQNAKADWFDREYMFGVTDGFDIVIGNPPYIQLQKNGGRLGNLYQDCNFQTFARTGDIYQLFYEKGIQSTRQGGVLCYITSNKWMRAGYGTKLRQFFLENNPLVLLDLGPDVFETATVDTNIIVVQNSDNQRQTKALTLTQQDNADMPQQIASQAVTLSQLNSEAWFIGSEAEIALKGKIERMGKPLKEWDVNIYRGIVTGLNEAFIIDSEKRLEILNNCYTEAEHQRTDTIIKPILRGKDVKRYAYRWAGLYLIFIPWHFPLHEDATIVGASEKAESQLKEQYPTMYNHLFAYKEKLATRNRDETSIRYEWYALQRCANTYYPEFVKEKIIYREISEYLNATYCGENNIFISNKLYMVTGANLKYLVSFLNSKVVNNVLLNTANLTGGKGANYLNNIPIPPITPKNQPIAKEIEVFVDKILAITKDQDYLQSSANQANVHEYEAKIDKLVYQLYNLTPSEISLIENNS